MNTTYGVKIEYYDLDLVRVINFTFSSLDDALSLIKLWSSQMCLVAVTLSVIDDSNDKV